MTGIDRLFLGYTRSRALVTLKTAKNPNANAFSKAKGVVSPYFGMLTPAFARA